jgi:uncharacterized protein YodC (DUF2158 family)
MSYKYKFGDVVMLKSGSKIMTIKGHPVRNTTEGSALIPDSYLCSWQEGKKFKKAVYPENFLIKV